MQSPSSLTTLHHPRRFPVSPPMVLAVLLALAPTVWASPPQGPLEAPPSFEPQTRAERDGWQAVTSERLDALRGGDNSQSNVLIDGRVDNNTADHVVSGDNVVANGAFGHAAGINTVVQNSGSNVLIQAGTAVSVQFADPTP